MRIEPRDGTIAHRGGSRANRATLTTSYHRAVRYPEVRAGGYSRVDGSVAFYGRVHAILAELPEPVTIMDFGAGRGVALEDPVPWRRSLRVLRGPGRTVIGVDVDPVVMENGRVDVAHVIDPLSGRIPLADESVDLIVSDFTLEHVDDPDRAVAELDRVLRPGGWFCARTPNRWGYIAVGARLVPNGLHRRALRRLQPDKRPEDTFPTRYRMNTRKDFDRLLAPDRWEVTAYTHDADPDRYSGSSSLAEGVLAVAHRLPGPFKSMWFLYARKLR